VPRADRISPGGVKLLQEPQLAHLATVLPDGSPQVTPVWVDVEADGSLIYINTADGRLKDRNVDQNPEVAVSVTDKDNFYRLVNVRGTIVERVHEGAAEHIDKLAKKYLGHDKYPWHQPGSTRVIYRIKPHHIVERGTE
jgi:PPOX class probable F420-dependent enzyme